MFELEVIEIKKTHEFKIVIHVTEHALRPDEEEKQKNSKVLFMKHDDEPCRRAVFKF
jgi:hypothetical protein